MVEKKYKVWWYWNWRRQFHQYKIPISINSIDTNKIKVSNKLSFSKQNFKYLIGYKDNKKLYLHPYFVQKLVYIEESLIKLDVCILLIKGGLFLTDIMKFWKKLAILSKTNSIETLHVIKNI